MRVTEHDVNDENFIGTLTKFPGTEIQFKNQIDDQVKGVFEQLNNFCGH